MRNYNLSQELGCRSLLDLRFPDVITDNGKGKGKDEPGGLRKADDPRTVRQPAQEDGKVVSPTYRSPLPQGRHLVLISLRG